MNQIEKFEEYNKILSLESYETIFSILKKFIFALDKYYTYDVYNIERLNLIVDAFKFFTGFDSKKLNYSKLQNITFEAWESYQNHEKYTFYQTIYVYSILISEKLQIVQFQNTVSGKRDICALHNLMTTIEPIMQYELENKKVKGKKYEL